MSFANHSQLLRTRRRLRNHANSRKYGQARISFDSEAGGPHKLILSQNSLDGCRDDQGPQCVVPGQPWQPQQGDITSFSFYFCTQNRPSYTMQMTAQNKMVWGIRAALARIGARSLFNPYMCVWPKKVANDGLRPFPENVPRLWPSTARWLDSSTKSSHSLSEAELFSEACSISHQRPNERVSRKINW